MTHISIALNNERQQSSNQPSAPYQQLGEYSSWWRGDENHGL